MYIDKNYSDFCMEKNNNINRAIQREKLKLSTFKYYDNASTISSPVSCKPVELLHGINKYIWIEFQLHFSQSMNKYLATFHYIYIYLSDKIILQKK